MKANISQGVDQMTLFAAILTIILLASIISAMIKTTKKKYNAVGIPQNLMDTSGFVCKSFNLYKKDRETGTKNITLFGTSHNATISATAPIVIQGVAYSIVEIRGEKGYDIDVPCPRLSPETEGAIDIVMSNDAFDSLTGSPNVIRVFNRRNGLPTNTWNFKQEEVLAQKTI